jgi:hypothetical protein
MVGVILRTVDECGELNTVNKECGLAAGKLSSSFAGLGAAAGAVVQQCPNDVAKANGYTSQDALRAAGQSVADPQWPDGLQATCTVDVKNSIAEVFKAATAISSAKGACEDGGAKCAYHAEAIVEALAALAKYLMGSVGDCSRPGAKLPENFPIHCSEAITNLIRQSTGFSGAATEMSVKCAPKPAPTPPLPAPTPAPAPVLKATVKVNEVQPVYPDSGLPAGPPIAVTEYNIEGDGKDWSSERPSQITKAMLRNNDHVICNGKPLEEDEVCTPQARLYGMEIVKVARRWQKDAADKTVSSINVNMGLTALLPITAIVAFAGGMKLRRHQAPYSAVDTGLDSI